MAVAGDPADRNTYWFGACAGGVWKTHDGGNYWRNVSDGFLTSSSIGAIAVAASDTAVVWVGTGESQVRNNVVAGDGVYRSTDGGDTWCNVGLTESRHVSRVRVHPTNPGIAYVAALGDIFGPSPERGIYRTVDGGLSWQQVLSVDDRTGAADLYLDPSDPSLLYASMWQAVRRPWEVVSGGPGSGLYRSTDGGNCWDRISDSPGFAGTLLGRIGVAASPARPGRLWALVEASDDAGGLYRSEDHGESWERLHGDSRLTGRPWYYSHIVADPSDGEVLYSMNVGFYRSADGGRSFTRLQTPHGDNHDVWIDPADPQRMIEGNDGGAAGSVDGGHTFGNVYNQSTAQIYRFDISPHFPFDLYGTQQDNSGIRVPSRSWKGAIKWWDCRDTGFAESGDVALDPADPRYVYLGGGGYGYSGPLMRFDEVTEQLVHLGVRPEAFRGVQTRDLRHRFGWTYPISFSPHDAGTLYVGGNRLWRSQDAGSSWTAISPDLTTNDPDLMGPSGGPITPEIAGAEIFCTIHAFTESPLTPGELWAGTDDGLVQLSRDGGRTWLDVTPPELPTLATVSRIAPSPHHAGTAYVAAHRYRLQDRAPYIFCTRDHGDRWQLIVEGLPEAETVRTVVADPAAATVLYAGAEHGVWVSRDSGESWRPLGAGLPPVPMYDLKVRDHELVVASHGRGFWILDDLTPVREFDPAADEVVLHTPPLTYRYPTPTGFDLEGEGVWIGGTHDCPLGGAAFCQHVEPDGSRRTELLEGGQNPPDGVAFWYRLPSGVAGSPVTVRILDESGQQVRMLTGAASQRGLNHTVWDLRARGPVTVPAVGADETGDAATDDTGPGHEVTDETGGPYVPPGTYRVELVAGGSASSTEVNVVRDPRSACSDEQIATQYGYLCEIRAALDEVAAATVRARECRADSAELVAEALAAAELALVGRPDAPTDPPSLHDKLTLLLSLSNGADAPPRQADRAVLEDVRSAIAVVVDGIDQSTGAASSGQGGP